MEVHRVKALARLIFIFVIPLIFILNCKRTPENSPPEIKDIITDPITSDSNRLAPGENLNITAIVSDPDDDPLIYDWSSFGGNIIGETNKSTITWEPNLSLTTNEYSIRVTVSDGKEIDTKSVSIYTGKSEIGELEGSVYYSGTKIPIPDVLIKLFDKKAHSNIYGYYFFKKIPQGDLKINAELNGSDDFEDTIHIGQGITKYSFEMLSTINTISIFGDITNQLENPVSGITVLLVNPDNTESKLTSISDISGHYQISLIPKIENIKLRFKKENIRTKEIELQPLGSYNALNVEIFEFGRPCNDVLTVIDYDGNIYNTIQIGNQCWMKENLKTTHFATGEEIKLIENESVWENLNYYDSAYCYYNNTLLNKDKYGLLYSWTAATGGLSNQDNSKEVKGVCPNGWHLPNISEWIELSDFLGGDDISGGRMKEEGILNWEYPNAGGNNLSGFTALPAGYRDSKGIFKNLNNYAYFWSSDTADNEAWFNYLRYSYSSTGRYFKRKISARSVRCVKN